MMKNGYGRVPRERRKWEKIKGNLREGGWCCVAWFCEKRFALLEGGGAFFPLGNFSLAIFFLSFGALGFYCSLLRFFTFVGICT